MEDIENLSPIVKMVQFPTFDGDWYAYDRENEKFIFSHEDESWKEDGYNDIPEPIDLDDFDGYINVPFLLKGDKKISKHIAAVPNSLFEDASNNDAYEAFICFEGFQIVIGDNEDKDQIVSLNNKDNKAAIVFRQELRENGKVIARRIYKVEIPSEVFSEESIGKPTEIKIDCLGDCISVDLSSSHRTPTMMEQYLKQMEDEQDDDEPF